MDAKLTTSIFFLFGRTNRRK